MIHILALPLSRLPLLGDITANCKAFGSSNEACGTGLPNVGAGTDQLQQILTIGFGIVAALAVLMIVIAGFRYTLTQGNPQEISRARSTILYAVIGLVVALAAEAIVALVLGKV
jgi:hypothetical protein